MLKNQNSQYNELDRCKLMVIEKKVLNISGVEKKIVIPQ